MHAHTKQMNLNQKIGLKLKQIRENNKINQAEMAVKLNVSYRTYQRYEHGEKNMTLVMMVKFANIMGTTTANLFSDCLTIFNHQGGLNAQ